MIWSPTWNWASFSASDSGWKCRCNLEFSLSNGAALYFGDDQLVVRRRSERLPLLHGDLNVHGRGTLKDIDLTWYIVGWACDEAETHVSHGLFANEDLVDREWTTRTNTETYSLSVSCFGIE